MQARRRERERERESERRRLPEHEHEHEHEHDYEQEHQHEQERERERERETENERDRGDVGEDARDDHDDHDHDDALFRCEVDQCGTLLELLVPLQLGKRQTVLALVTPDGLSFVVHQSRSMCIKAHLKVEACHTYRFRPRARARAVAATSANATASAAATATATPTTFSFTVLLAPLLTCLQLFHRTAHLQLECLHDDDKLHVVVNENHLITECTLAYVQLDRDDTTVRNEIDSEFDFDTLDVMFETLIVSEHLRVCLVDLENNDAPYLTITVDPLQHTLSFSSVSTVSTVCVTFADPAAAASASANGEMMKRPALQGVRFHTPHVLRFHYPLGLLRASVRCTTASLTSNLRIDANGLLFMQHIFMPAGGAGAGAAVTSAAMQGNWIDFVVCPLDIDPEAAAERELVVVDRASQVARAAHVSASPSSSRASSASSARFVNLDGDDGNDDDEQELQDDADEHGDPFTFRGSGVSLSAASSRSRAVASHDRRKRSRVS